MKSSQSDLETIARAKQVWETDTLKPVLDKGPERKRSFASSSGVELRRVYTPLDAPEWDYPERNGFPGAFPYTRGIQPTMYRGRLWTMRQYAGFGTAAQSNQRYRYLLDQGQTGLSVAFDLPTQMGYDSDDPMAMGEVGRTGVAIDTVEDMDILFNNIPLERVSTSMTINATAATLLAMYLAVARRHGAALERLRGTIQNDILKEYMARGTYIYPPRPSMRLITDIFTYCKDHVPRWNTISISGYHIREAGATAVQEVAFTLADGIAYVEAALETGLDVDAFAPRLSFFFNVHNHLLEEVAKFRAARRLWARIMRERFHARNPRSQMLRFHTQTAGSTLTAQQPQVNVVRVTLQALAAVLGGTQSLHTNSLDEALALPTEQSARLALRTQQVIGFESGVTDVVDPLGGSWAIESLTDQIEAEARRYMDKIDTMGGMVAAIEQGYPQREIQEAAYRHQQRVESGETEIVGVNIFQEDDAPAGDILKIDPAVEEEQVARVVAIRRGRSRIEVHDALARLEDAAGGTDNLLPHILCAVEAHATLGEISNTLRGVFGAYKEVIVL